MGLGDSEGVSKHYREEKRYLIEPTTIQNLKTGQGIYKDGGFGIVNFNYFGYFWPKGSRLSKLLHESNDYSFDRLGKILENHGEEEGRGLQLGEKGERSRGDEEKKDSGVPEF